MQVNSRYSHPPVSTQREASQMREPNLQNRPAELAQEQHAAPPLDVGSLIQRKLLNPSHHLNSEESIAVLRECVLMGETEASKAIDQELVVCIGNTGAGKSTLVNYLYGCTMQKVPARELGVQAMSSKVVTVKPKAAGGALDEIMPIGHTTQSMTFMPHIAADQRGLTYCDCPGFLDNRGFEINIANAVNIKNAFSKAKSLKVIMLINYHSLLADKARGLTEMIKISCDLFGTMERLIEYKDSILLGVTQIPLARPDDDERTLEELKQWIAGAHLQDEFANQTLRYLAERLFIYDPLDASGLEFSGAWKRSEVLGRIADLKPIPYPSRIFRTVLTAEDERGLVKICDQMRDNIQGIFRKEDLKEEDFKKIAFYQESLNKLEIIDHTHVTRLVASTRGTITDHLRQMIHTFEQYCADTESDMTIQSEEMLAKLKKGVECFDEQIQSDLNLTELEKRYDLYKKKRAAKEAIQTLQDMEKSFHTYCRTTNFAGAQDLLTKIKEKVNFFDQAYALTGVKHNIKIQELENTYKGYKKDHDDKIIQQQKHAEEIARLKKQQEDLIKQQAAREAVQKLQKMEKNFRACCQKTNFSEAQDLLIKIKEQVSFFDRTYAPTGIQHKINVQELERTYKAYKEDHDKRLAARKAVQKLQEMEENFHACCQKKNFSEAQDLLIKIKEQVSFFDRTYGSTDIEHGIDIQRLQSIYSKEKLKDEIVGGCGGSLPPVTPQWRLREQLLGVGQVGVVPISSFPPVCVLQTPRGQFPILLMVSPSENVIDTSMGFMLISPRGAEPVSMMPSHMGWVMTGRRPMPFI